MRLSHSLIEHEGVRHIVDIPLYQDKNFMHQKLIVEDMTYKELSKEIGFSVSAVQSWATKFELNRGEKWERIKKAHGDEIIRLYTEENKTIKDIGDIFECVDQTVRKVLVESGVSIRSLSESKFLRDKNHVHRKYNLNESYFRVWSNNMAYILGLIYSDGNMRNGDYTSKKDGRTRRRNLLSLVLQEEDKEILEKVKEEMGYGGVIHTRPSQISGRFTGKNHCELKMNSEEMIGDLKKIGLTERKSLTKEFPNIPEEYELDFIRGYFDGNGSVGRQYPTNSMGKRTETCQIRVRICSGSEEFLSVLKDKLIKYELKDKKISAGKGRTIFEVCYSTKESLILYDLIYKNKESMKLSRKYEDFTSHIQQRKEDIKNSNGGIKIL